MLAMLLQYIGVIIVTSYTVRATLCGHFHHTTIVFYIRITERRKLCMISWEKEAGNMKRWLSSKKKCKSKNMIPMRIQNKPLLPFLYWFFPTQFCAALIWKKAILRYIWTDLTTWITYKWHVICQKHHWFCWEVIFVQCVGKGETRT